MSQRTIPSLSGGQMTVDPAQDELILDNRKDASTEAQYFLHTARGIPHFYAYRPRQRAFGEDLHEVCEEISMDEVQAEILRVAEYEPLNEYADLDRLRALGFHVPGPRP